MLTDRGLEAALSALTARVPLPVALTIDLDRRPPEAVEAAAYFIVAEALGGRLDIQSPRGRGTAIQAWLPEG